MLLTRFINDCLINYYHIGSKRGKNEKAGGGAKRQMLQAKGEFKHTQFVRVIYRVLLLFLDLKKIKYMYTTNLDLPLQS